MDNVHDTVCASEKLLCTVHHNFPILSEAFEVFFSGCWILCELWVQCFCHRSSVKTGTSCKQLESVSLFLLQIKNC